MKKLYIFLLLACFSFTGFSQILSESFDGSTFPPTGWTLVDEDMDGYNWGQILAADGWSVNTGDGAVLSASYDNVVGALTPDNWLITPQVDLTSVSSATLKWYVYAEDQAWADEHYRIAVSTNGTAISDFTNKVYSEIVGTSSGYMEKTLDISAFAGSSIYIAFVHDSITDMYVMSLDDISVTSGVGIDENDTKVVMNIFPNPVVDIMTIASSEEMSQMKIYNAVGQEVVSQYIEGKELHYNVSSLEPGVYFVAVEFENGIQTRKIHIK